MSEHFAVFAATSLITLVVSTLIAGVLAAGMQRLTITTDLRIYFSDDNPQLASLGPVIQNQFCTDQGSRLSLNSACLPDLDELCRQQPGNVLAMSNDDHYNRYHTALRCAGQQFFLTPQHFDKVAEVNDLLGLRAEEFLRNDQNIDYVFARFVDLPSVVQPGPEGFDLEKAFMSNPPLFLN